MAVAVWIEMKVQGYDVVPIPGSACTLEGIILGVTLPYCKPWDLPMHRAANEPVKPPEEAA